MDKVIAYSNRSEIRDKISRLIMYIAKLAAWVCSKSKKDQKLQKKFLDLFRKINKNKKKFIPIKNLI